MSNLFEEVLGDLQQVEQNLIGPSYPYSQNILAPQYVGMSTDGTTTALSNNISGLRQYINLLVSGYSSASATGGPLGNKFFMQTGGQCTDTSTNQLVDRYIYINNVPTGDIDFSVNMSAGMGGLNSGLQGLIPGALGDLSVLNPYALLQSFLAKNPGPCQEITMETIDVSNNTSSETNYVTVSDITNMDPCTFPNNTNPITNAKCSESFQTNAFQSGVSKNSVYVMSDDPLQMIYLMCLSFIGIYILYCLMQKST
jgi:hypothetical protein